MDDQLHDIVEQHGTCAKSFVAFRNSGILTGEDVKERRWRLFEIGRRIANIRGLTGFGMRFSIHYNLFLNTVSRLGTEKHNDVLVSASTIGCFGLTESENGAMTGQYNTATATFKDGNFTLNAKGGGMKTYVTNADIATHMIVTARLLHGTSDHGLHAFVVAIRDEHGNMIDGVTNTERESYPITPTLGISDVEFDNVVIPYDALLDKHARFDGDAYECDVGKMNMHVIGDSLLCGRLMIAQCCLTTAMKYIERVETYATNKRNRNGCLYDIPSVAHVITHHKNELRKTIALSVAIEHNLCIDLKNNPTASFDMSRACAAIKIRSCNVCQDAIRHTSALLGGQYFRSGVQNMSAWLHVCETVEGSNLVLSQWLAHSEVKTAPACTSLATTTLKAILYFSSNPRETWNENIALVHAVANVAIENVLNQYT